MAANPLDHVKDMPYFAIGKDGGVVLPKVTHEGKHYSVAFEGELMGGADMPALFTVHTLSIIVVSIILMVGAIKAVKGVSLRPEQGRGALTQLFEVLVKFIRDDVCRPNLGPHGGKYIPLMLTFFFLILFCNLWGLVPAVFTTTATGNINVTAALAMTMLGCFFFLGMKEQGVGPFWKNIAPSGVPLPILIILYPIELLGPFAKCFALCVRLFANMVAGHVILATFIGLSFAKDGSISMSIIPAFTMAVAISCLEVFVAILQAYVFTILSSVFLGGFIHPDH